MLEGVVTPVPAAGRAPAGPTGSAQPAQPGDDALQRGLVPGPAQPRQADDGAPGGRRTLADELEGFLKARDLPKGVERAQFVAEGMAYLHELEREAAEG